MSGRTAGQASIRNRLGAAVGSALLMSSLVGWFAPVAAAGPLSITNVDSPDPVQSGAQILYTIVVTNTGGSKVDNIVLTDQVNSVVGFGNPPLLDVVSTRGNCTQTNTQVTCNAGSIEGRGVWTVTVRGVVTAPSGTTINNIATVVASKSAQTYTTSAAATTQVQGSGPGGPSPDLTIAKNGPLQVTPGTGITYTLTVNNLGNGNAVGVKVTDTIPAAITPVTVNATSLFTCSIAAQTVTCLNGRVNAGSNATITINGNVSSAAAGTLENTSVVDPENTIDEGILGDTADAAELNNFSNTVVTNVSPVPPPVTDAITLDKQGPASAIPGQLIQYTLHVKNGTLGRADYLTLTDGTQGLQAASLRVVSAVASSGTTPQCVVAAPTVSCTMTRLAVDGTLDVVIEGMVVASAGSTIINSAAVNANIRNTGYTARDEVQTIINAGIDLTITKADSPDPVCASSFPNFGTTACRGGLTYTFVVGNSGINTASNVVVRDPLPPGTTFDPNPAVSDPRCSVLAGIVTCTIVSLPGGATDTIKINVVAPATLGTITNTVTVDPFNAILEADETNNIAVATTTVATGIDLVIRKDDETNDPGDAPPNFNIIDSLPGFDPIATSGTQTYTITVDNLGTQDATGIRVRDALPAGTTFLSATGDHLFTCSQSSGTVECVGGAIHGTNWELYQGNGPDFATIIIKVFAMPNVGTMHNEVRVDPLNEIAEYDETNNFDFEDTVVGTGNAGVGAFNQLTVTKTQISPAGATPADFEVATNGTLIYNLHVQNLGTDPVSNVVVKDFLPSGTRFIQASDTGSGSAAFFCSHDGSAFGGVVTCTGGDLSGSVNTIPGVPTSRDITVTVFAPNTPGTYTNLATVDPDNLVPEGNEFDNDSSIQTKVTVGGHNAFNELTILKSQTDPAANQVATSSIVTYQIVVTNAGTDPAFNVRVLDTLPAGFTFVSAVDLAGATDPFSFDCAPAAGNTIDCTGATLSGTPNTVPGEPITRTIEVKARASSIPGTYINTARVDPANTIPEGNETNNLAQAMTTVKVGTPTGFVDLSLTKCDQPPAPCTIDSDPVVPSGNVTYVLTATNNGTDPAFNVKVTDALPAGTGFVSAADTAPGAGAFTCTFGSGVITCSGGTIDGSADLIPSLPTSRTIEVVLTAPASNGTITNQAAIDPDNAIAESNETNNSAVQTTTVSSKINLTLDKHGPDTAHQNDTADYVITVKNEAVYGGGATAFGVRVHDALPVGLIPLSVEATPSNMICQITENPVNVVDCVGDMSAPGASPDSSTVTITIHVFVTADGGTLDNEACVDPTDPSHPNGTIIESNEGDNCKTKTTTVLKLAPDLLVNKTVDASTATPGQTLTYTVTVSNVGNASAASPITVTDELDPAKVDFVSASGTNGFNPCTFSSPDVTCTGGGLAPGDSTTITIVAKVKTGVTGSIVNKASVPDNTPFDSGAPECAGSACVNEGDPASSSTNADNTASVTTSIGGSGIDLVMLSLTDDIDPTAPGGIVTYTATVKNQGTADATGAVIRVTLPATGLNHIISSASNGFLCTFLFPNIDCTGNLPSGGTTVITVVTDVTATAPPDTSVTVTATADPALAIVEDDETNNTKSQTTTVSASCATGCVDLVASPIVVSPAAVHVGDTATFIVGVGNAGDTATGTFDIDLKLSGAGYDFDGSGFENVQPSADYSATPGATTGFDCNFGVIPIPADTVRCTGDLNGGQGVLIILKVHVTSTGTTGHLDLHVTADSGGTETEFSETNNEANASVTVAP
jgi:uncharacterized repeat protein (TIGR01451 family)